MTRYAPGGFSETLCFENNHWHESHHLNVRMKNSIYNTAFGSSPSRVSYRRPRATRRPNVCWIRAQELACGQSISRITDLILIQPEWTPLNCTFEINELEKLCALCFIHCRGNEGCFSEPRTTMQKVYNALSPGGYLEIGGVYLPPRCDNGTLPKKSAIWRWHALVEESAEKIGRPVSDALGKHTEFKMEIGFIDIVYKEFVWPFNSWPSDPCLKEIGRYHCVDLDLGLEGLSLTFLTRVLGWTREDVLALCGEARQNLRNRKMHGYCKIYYVSARKPEKALEEPEN